MSNNVDQIFDLGKRIEKKVEELDISQSELSRRSGLSRNLVHSVINGTKNPGIITIAKIAKTLNLSLDELVGIRLPTTIISKLDKIILNKKDFKIIYEELEQIIKNIKEKSHSDNNINSIHLVSEIAYNIIMEILSNPDFSSTSLKTLLEALYETYEFCSKENNNSIDTKFISWYARSKL